MNPIERSASLGIDAAWSTAHDSGYALVERVGTCRCRLLAAGSSVVAFAAKCRHGVAGGRRRRLDGSLALASAATRLGGALPQVVAADLPLSRRRITGRRVADDAISRRFGRAGCGTHSPSAKRPGAVGRGFQAALEAEGFRLATLHDEVHEGTLVEVYPHPALLALMPTKTRVPYKVGKTRCYWPDKTRAERFALVRAQLHQIAERLDVLVAGTLNTFATLVDRQRTFSGLKPAEDVLDAILSAWVGILALEGEAEPFGDDAAAIWVPMAGRGQPTRR